MATRKHSQSFGATVINKFGSNDSTKDVRLVWTDSVTSGSMPNFQQKLKKFENATTGLIGYRAKASGKVNGVTELVSMSSGGIALTNYHGIPLTLYDPVIDSSLQQTADNSAASDALSRVAEFQNSFGGPQILFELRKTIHGIRHPAESLAKYIKKDLHNMKKSTKGLKGDRFSKVISDSWLEAQFGWKPLLSDIDDIAKEAAETAREVYNVIIGSGSASHGVSRSGTYVAGYVIACNFNTTEKLEVSRRYRVGVYSSNAIGDNSASALERLRDHSGFNLPNVIPTAWELLPFSFLVDYFSNVGDVINASLTSQSSVRWVCNTTRSKATRITQSSGTPKTGYITRSIGSASFQTEVVRVSRSGQSSIPLPVLSFNLPSSNLQLLNIAALLNSLR